MEHPAGHRPGGIRALAETGNVSVDAILNAKLSLVLKKDIDLNFKAEVPKALAVSDIDLCVILGNLIDNAMESCEKVPAGKRFPRLYIGVYLQFVLEFLQFVRGFVFSWADMLYLGKTGKE